jgi:hypothetical protein
MNCSIVRRWSLLKDYDLWARALAKRLVLVNIPDVLYGYRTHSAQVTSTNKNWEKNREIGFRYIESVFPGISREQISQFYYLRTFKDPGVVKSVCQDLEKENREVDFIRPRYLHTKLKRYYQGRLYERMRIEGINWSSVFDLRAIQFFRLLIDRIHDKRRNTVVQ